MFLLQKRSTVIIAVGRARCVTEPWSLRYSRSDIFQLRKKAVNIAVYPKVNRYKTNIK